MAQGAVARPRLSVPGHGKRYFSYGCRLTPPGVGDQTFEMQGTSRSFTVGRDTGCDIPIADDSVSRIHAAFRVQPDGRIVITDNRSRNGTSVLRAGRPLPVEEEMVSRDDEVQFGDVVLRVSDLLDAVRHKLPPTLPAADSPTEPVDPVRLAQTSIAKAVAFAKRRWRETIIAAMALAGMILVAVDPQSQSFKFIVGIIGSVIASLVLSMVQQYWQKKQ